MHMGIDITGVHKILICWGGRRKILYIELYRKNHTLKITKLLLKKSTFALDIHTFNKNMDFL